MMTNTLFQYSRVNLPSSTKERNKRKSKKKKPPKKPKKKPAHKPTNQGHRKKVDAIMIVSEEPE